MWNSYERFLCVQTTRKAQNLLQPAFNMVTSRLALITSASSAARRVLMMGFDGNAKLMVLWRKPVFSNLLLEFTLPASANESDL